MKDSTMDLFEGLIVDPSKVDLRKCVIFPELVGLTMSVNDILDIVHQVTSKGLFSKDFIDEQVKELKNEHLRSIMEAYNKGLNSADIAIRSVIISRFKKR